MTTSNPTPVLEDEHTYCAVHPDRETALQCNKCGRYMCVQCAVPTPVGYRCKECVRGIEDKFFNASPADPAIVFAVCAVLSGIGAFIAAQVVPPAPVKLRHDVPPNEPGRAGDDDLLCHVPLLLFARLKWSMPEGIASSCGPLRFIVMLRNAS